MTTKTNEMETPTPKQTEPAFTKAQVLASRVRYVRYKDLFSAKLKDGEKYTHAQLEALIKKAYKTTK